MMKPFKIFTHPYILIEDGLGKHQPFFKEYTSNPPRLNTQSPELCCPFQENKRYKPPTNKRRVSKSGFCEVCYVRYGDYESHVTEVEHREFARDKYNFTKLDSFMYGMPFRQYKKSMNRRIVLPKYESMANLENNEDKLYSEWGIYNSESNKELGCDKDKKSVSSNTKRAYSYYMQEVDSDELMTPTDEKTGWFYLGNNYGKVLRFEAMASEEMDGINYGFSNLMRSMDGGFN